MNLNNIKHREGIVVTAYCNRNGKLFGIRTERIDSNRWIQDWAFPIDSVRAASEKYDKNQVNGEILISEEYPGCPYCGAQGWFECAMCKSIVCRNNESSVICPKCGNVAENFVDCSVFELTGGAQ